MARATGQKIERGDLGSSIGRVFELAALVGVPLFEPDADRIRRHLAQGEDILSLLPKHTHPERQFLNPYAFEGISGPAAGLRSLANETRESLA